jgi:EmrB/QacA subfamily drug resistance transporter
MKKENGIGTDAKVQFHQNRTAVLIIILASYLMVVLDISITITALPKLQQDLGFSSTGLSWVQNGYTLAFGGLLLLSSRAGDILGLRRMFILGISLFTIASLAIALSPSASWLIGMRVLQGIGAAFLAPSTLALLTANFPEGEERTRAVSYYGAIAGIGASIGLLLGGIFTYWISWRAGFFINIPIGIIMLLAAPRFIAETEKRPGRFDLVGAVSSTLGMTVFVYGIVRSADVGWNNAVTIGSLLFGVLLLGFFVFNEWRAEQPIMPLRLFKNRERVGAYLSRFLFLGAMMGFWFFITQFLQIVSHYSPLEAGLAFLPMTVANFVMAIAVPKFTRRFGNPSLLAGGVFLTMFGMFWLSRLSVDTFYLTGIALPMILIGIGQGASLGPLTASGIAGVGVKDAGAASGLVNVSHQIGGSFGLGILVTVFASTSSPTLNEQGLLAKRIATSLTGSTLMLLLAVIVVVTMVLKSHNTIKISGK